MRKLVLRLGADLFRLAELRKREVADDCAAVHPGRVVAPSASARTQATRSLLERAQAFVDDFDEELRDALPADALLFDAHVHVGRDSDGMVAELPELLGMLDRHGVSYSFAFCLDEPDRKPSFRAGNDRTLEHARTSGDRILPFARLDLSDDPIAEGRRCLELGARGIKLHPRAQGFGLDDARLAAVFGLSEEYEVPILIHGGHGLPPIAADLHRLVTAHPGARLIVAHAGIADLPALAGCFAGTAGVFFDTATWSALDLIDLFRRVPPEQILYASDYPYGQQPTALLATLRVARFARLSEPGLRAVLGENAARIARREPPAASGRPAGSAILRQPVALARVHQCLSMAAPLLWKQRRDSIGVLDLAITAAVDESLDAVDLERLRSMLEIARALWTSLPALEDYGTRRIVARSMIQLIQLADVVACTTITDPRAD